LSIIPRPSEIGIIAEVGLYGAAYKVIDVLITLPFMFAGIILPILTARYAGGLREEFKDIYQKSFDAMVLFAIPMMVGTYFIATQTMSLVAGQKFAASGPILSILIIAAGAVFIGSIPAHAVIAIDKQKKIIGAYFFVALTSILGYALLIPRFSYFGAAWVTIYSEVIIALASVWLVYRYTQYLPSFKVFIKSILASIIMIIAIIYYPKLLSESIWATVIIGMLSYTLGIIIVKGIKKEDFNILLNRN
jgi:O-antigen/teichoic acid export membrane protein